MATQLLTPAECYERFLGPGIFGPLARILVGYVSPRAGERVLDLASGSGLVARHVAPIVDATGRVVAVDINPAMLAVARQQVAPEGAVIEWVEGDAVTIDLADQRFDIVICQQGLQFFSDRAAALDRARRLLAAGSRSRSGRGSSSNP